MCWNKDVSLNTFLFSGFVLLLVIYNNKYTQYKNPHFDSIWMYIFISSVILIQLIENFLWKNINDPYYNRVFSFITLIVVLLHPILSLMIITDTNVRNIMILIYSVLVTFFGIMKLKSKDIYSDVSPGGHLHWNFATVSPNIIILYIFFFFFSFIYQKCWIGTSISIIILLLLVLYNFGKDRTMWSMWCWITSVIMIYHAGYLLLYLPFREKLDTC